MDNQEFIRGGSDTLEFRQIILSHLRKILDLSLKMENPVDYKNGILSLSDVLYPFYDEEMKKANKQYLEDYIKYKKETSEECNRTTLRKLKLHWLIGTHRKLFIALNLLLQRNDYLKASVYSEIEDAKEEIVEVDK